MSNANQCSFAVEEGGCDVELVAEVASDNEGDSEVGSSSFVEVEESSEENEEAAEPSPAGLGEELEAGLYEHS